MALNQFNKGVGDWRHQLASNERKTKIVIATFIAIFILVGLLMDTALGMGLYHASAKGVFNALIRLRITPYATLIMLVIAAVCLLVTYSFYNRIMLMGTDSFEITPESARSTSEQKLYNVVEEMKVAAGLHYMPKVYVIEANYMNAFASGYSEKSAMVAITRGLMNKLDRSELQAVMAHELSHIRHHDIKLTLTVSVLSNILLIAIDFLFYSLLFSNNSRSNRNNKGGGNALFLIVMLLRFILPFITAGLTLFLSRTREFMADSGAVELMRDNEPLGRALIKINSDHFENQEQNAHEYAQTSNESVRRASYIYDPVKFSSGGGVSDLFSTHPSLERRLKALGFNKKSD